MPNILCCYAQKTQRAFGILSKNFIHIRERLSNNGFFCAITLSPTAIFVCFLALLVKLYKHVKKYLLT